MKSRQSLKALYTARETIDSHIQSETVEYILELNGKRGLYITDHAIVRYLERVRGWVFNEELSDEAKLVSSNVDIRDIREEMLSLDEDYRILNSRISYYRRGAYGYVVKGLSIVTVTEI